MEKRHVGQAAWEGPTRTFQCVDRPLSGTQAIGTEVRAGRSAKGLQGMKPRRSLLSRATEEGLSASHRSTFFSELPVGQWYSAWPRSPCRRPSDRATASITWTAPWRDHFKKLASGSNTNVLKNPLAVIFKTMRSHWDPLQSKAGMVLSGCHAWKAAGSSREDAEEGAQLSEIHRRETTSRQVAFHSYRFPLLTGAPVLSDPRSGFPQPQGVVCGDAQGALAGSGPGPSRENSPLRGSLSRGPEPPEQGDLHPWRPCWPPTSHPAPGAPCAAGAQPPLRIPPPAPPTSLISTAPSPATFLKSAPRSHSAKTTRVTKASVCPHRQSVTYPCSSCIFPSQGGDLFPQWPYARFSAPSSATALCSTSAHGQA